MRYFLFLSIFFLATNLHAQEPKFAKHDTNLPIEITSDSLEVQQHDEQATFTGNVESIQGKIRLNSDKMVVHYEQSDEEEEKTKTSTYDPAAQNAISKVEVYGNVFFSTPEETAEGDEGLYDVKNESIILHGNVVVTKGKNVVKGDHLHYNLASGKSTLTTEKGNVPSSKDGTGRVKAIFVPKKKGQEGKE